MPAITQRSLHPFPFGPPGCLPPPLAPHAAVALNHTAFTSLISYLASRLLPPSTFPSCWLLPSITQRSLPSPSWPAGCCPLPLAPNAAAAQNHTAFTSLISYLAFRLLPPSTFPPCWLLPRTTQRSIQGRKEGRFTHPWQPARLIGWSSVWVGQCDISAMTSCQGRL